MITRLTTISQLKELFIKGVLNNTDKVTKISDESTLNGYGYGVGKVAQKSIKDIAIVESRLFAESASGSDLDDIAVSRGISPRLGAIGSSTFILLVGTPGIIYTASIHNFTGGHGIIFELESDFTMPDEGYGYAKVRSLDTGLNTQIDPLTLTSLTTSLSGHDYVINEYKAIGGRDSEIDDIFKKRIREESINILAQDTLSKLTQVFININSNILKVFYNGRDETGKIVLGVITQNGANLSSTEIDELLQGSEPYFSFSDFRRIGSNSFGVKIINTEIFPIDVDFRAELLANYDPDEIRINIQIALSKYLDFRFWDYSKKVEWDDLLQIVKNIVGVKYIPDTLFYPNVDKEVPQNYLPRVRQFIMRNLDGDILVDGSGNLNPIYYPNSVDSNFTNTILKIIE